MERLCSREFDMTHSHYSCQKSHSPAFNPLIALQQMPSTDLFQHGITTPRSNWHLVFLFNHILQPCVNNKLLLQVKNAEGLSHPFARLHKEVGPPLEDMVIWNRAIIGLPMNRVFHLLVPASRLEMPAMCQFPYWNCKDDIGKLSYLNTSR